MRPIHIVVFVLAGALGGAILMKFVPHATSPVLTAKAPVVAQQPAATPPVSEPSAQTVPAPPASPSEPAAATPAPESRHIQPAPPSHSANRASRREARATPPAHRPQPVHHSEPQPVRRTEPAPQSPIVAKVNPPAAPAPVQEPDPAIATLPPAQPSTPPVKPSTPPAQTENVTPPSPAEPPPPTVTLNAGLLIPVRLIDGLSAERNAPGDPFTASLDRELVVDGFVIAERGARVDGRVVASDRGGRVRGVSTLAIELTRVHTSDGQDVPIQTEAFEKRAAPDPRQDAEKIAGGAALGAIVGAIAGGGKGAAVGAGVGGGAGAGDVLLTRGKPASLPSETRLTFRLNKTFRLTERLPQ